MSRAKSKQKLRRNTLKVARKKYVERKKERIKVLREQSVSVIAETPAPTPSKRATVTRKSTQH